MARRKTKKPETQREVVIDAVNYLKKTPNGFVRFNSEGKKEHKELLKLVEELVDEELQSRMEFVCY